MSAAVRRGLGATVMVLALVIAFGWWNYTTVRSTMVETRVPNLILGGKPVPAAQAPGLAAALRQQIIKRPLSQLLVDQYYSLISLNSLANAGERERWRQQVAALGWRSGAAQINLMGQGALAADMRAVLDRTDALMRRQYKMEQVGNLLYLVEQDPQTQPLLIQRLYRGVPWRTFFFMNPTGTATDAGRMARVRTLDALLRMKSPLTRTEVASFLVAMRSPRDLPEAYRIWRAFRSQQETAPALGTTFDPGFTLYPNTGAEGSIGLPFEWEPLSGAGYSADIDSGAVTLNWDGSGAPVLLRQTFRALPQRYRVMLRGPDANVGFLNHFTVNLECPTGPIRFGNATAIAGGVTALSDGAVGCAFPTLTVKGSPGMGFEQVVASLSFLAAQPVG